MAVRRTCGAEDRWGGGGEPHLVHTVQELQEDGREAAALAAGTQVAPLAELVAEGQPLFLQQHLKTLQSPVERVAQQLHQRHHLQREKGERKPQETGVRVRSLTDKYDTLQH